jgi:hypothetical protein
MAVEDEGVVIIYSTDGIATAFSFPFYFRAITDLVVEFTDSLGVVTTKILNTDYSISGTLDAKLNVYSEGGTVTFAVAPAAGGQLLITRHTPRAQTAIYNPQDPFPAGSHEAALDNAILIIQEMLAGFQGVAQGPPTSGTFAVGDWFWIQPPVLGGPRGLVCVVAGTPGTWAGWGQVSLLPIP